MTSQMLKYIQITWGSNENADSDSTTWGGAPFCVSNKIPGGGDAACLRMWQQNSSPKAIYPT